MPNLIKLGSKIIFHEEFIDSKPFRNHHGSLLSYFLLQACRSDFRSESTYTGAARFQNVTASTLYSLKTCNTAVPPENNGQITFYVFWSWKILFQAHFLLCLSKGNRQTHLKYNRATKHFLIG